MTSLLWTLARMVLVVMLATGSLYAVGGRYDVGVGDAVLYLVLWGIVVWMITHKRNPNDDYLG